MNGRCRGLRRKGQLSIEFFLVLSIIIAFSIILYNVSRDETAKTKAVNAVLLTKNAVDALSNAVDFVALSGNASALNSRVFISREANCLYYNASRNAFYCVVTSPALQPSLTEKHLVFGPRLASTLAKNLEESCTASVPLRPGWWELRVRSVGDAVNVSCFPR
ncbi:MAG: hypothetical protein QW343_00955 [Candidatus Norongarragalinales archaeon]